MDEPFSPKDFWTRRFLAHGHTGEVDPLLYGYDQPRRLTAIARALALAGVRITTQTRVLDFGCGTGDVIASLLRMGNPEITGVDISPDTARHARERFAGRSNVAVLVGTAEDMDFSDGSFDLAVGINVLQHIQPEAALTATLARLRRMVMPGGHIVVMDCSPIRVVRRSPAPYIVVRSRAEYLQGFEEAGWRHVSEYPLPQIGVHLYRSLNAALAGLRGGGGADRKVGGSRDRRSPRPSGPGISGPGMARRAVHLLRSTVLFLAAPLDALLTPSAPHRAEMRILIFENSVRT